MSKFTRILVVLCAVIAPCGATVTLGFNDPFISGISSNLANASGAVTNGMSWGILVDAGGNGFSSTYDAVSFSAGEHSLLVGGVSSDDVLIISADPTQSTVLLGAEGGSSPGTPGGNGGVTSIVNYNYSGVVGSGDVFRLVWIDPSGNTAGSLSHASFILPSDNSTTSAFAAAFEGVDPVRSATGITFVPEPSAALLGGLGALALLRRRRVA